MASNSAIASRSFGRPAARFSAKSVGAFEPRSYGIFGRGVVMKPGLDGPKGATPETFIGPLRDPAGALSALDQLRVARGDARGP